MKFLSITISFVFLTAARCLSQDSTSVYLTKLPYKGIVLDKGWKFQAGDNPEYAKPGYDDSKWQSINPALDIHELPQIKQGVVWFRLHLFIDSNLANEQLALAIEQSGASEIYLNGNSIHSFGLLNTDVSKVRAYNPLGFPIGFPVEKGNPQILAVRYALQPGLRYTTIFANHNFGLKPSLNTAESATQIYRDRGHLESLQLFIMGILVMLLVLHLSFYLYYRPQKASLFFSLYALLTLIASIMNFTISNSGHWVDQVFFWFNLGAYIIYIGFLSMVTAIYYLLEQKRGRWYYILMILSLLSMITYTLPGYWGWEKLSLAFNILLNLEISRIAFIAVKEKRKGAWIIAVGCVSCLLCWTTFLSVGRAGEDDLFTIIVFAMAWLSIPVSASIYTGVNFAFTNRLLQKKLSEVSELSQKTIAQEKEKQQILSSVNETLERQVAERTNDLKTSFEELKATQNQLIQSEKMASLGELTAGIAHEIQNPLNFVNNFSEVNNELITEMVDEFKNGNTIRAEAVAMDLKQNLEKISHHGKRADGIVKNMLQHSRTSSGFREATDINALCDEYLRLAYHGMRAKDKSFNAKLETDFDNSIGKVNIVPQEIGRVVLNLLNNAFYAVNEKLNHPSTGSAGQSYEPTVKVITKKADSGIEIRVSDNGNGIPQKHLDKIFQPFFTTKPTGQGTGLGLSLAYDIVKAHGGELKVETNERKSARPSARTGTDGDDPRLNDSVGRAVGQGSEFIITIPLN